MSEKHMTYQRFRLWERIEHLVLIISFTTLALTGLPQKYALAPISQFFIRLLGGIETIRVIHHIAAIVFVVEAVYHLVVVGYKIFVQRKSASMLPGIKDGKDAIQWLGRNLGIVKEGPRMPRYNFMEKAEYWAMLWGLFLMALTGFMLWNPIATTNILPGEFIPAAKAAHGGEAVLAVLAILLWHFYNVHFKHMNWSMIRGTLTHHEMEDEHGAELDELQTRSAAVVVDPVAERRRMTIFAPVAAVVSVALLAGLFYFVTFEESSLTTIPPVEQVEAFAPQTPTPAAAPQQPAPSGSESAEVTWEGAIGPMLAETCSGCHGKVGGFNAESYEEVMKAVTPGDPDGSRIVASQQGGDHPGQLDEDQLAMLVAWIEAGAPQGAPAEGATGEGGGGAAVWAGSIETLFADQCGKCHGSMGGFSAESYEDVMKAVEPGDPDASGVVEVQKAGDHPGQFTEDELLRVIDWIASGAPEK